MINLIYLYKKLKTETRQKFKTHRTLQREATIELHQSGYLYRKESLIYLTMPLEHIDFHIIGY